MLIYLYLFALIVGGVLLGASILLGGDHDGDADFDLDGDGDLDLDGDADADFGEGGDAAAHGDFDVHGAPGFLWSAFKSVRFWTFFLAFFGLTGLTLDGLGLVGTWPLTLLAAVGMGLASGMGAVAIIRSLASDDSGAVASESDYLGKTARVLVPVTREGVGKVRVQIKGSTVDVLATTDEDAPVQAREEVMIIEMDGTRARVARVDDD